MVATVMEILMSCPLMVERQDEAFGAPIGSYGRSGAIRRSKA
jgi:hypothetical protein